jgi:uncharacterized protein (TIGR02996 family)
MSDVDPLLRGIRDRPTDNALRLVLADWLEERGDEASLARARLVRLQVECARARGSAARAGLDAEAEALIKGHRGLLRSLAPLRRVFPLLSLPALPLFLAAPLAGVHDGPLAAGSTWEGHLSWQRTYSFPTTLRIRKRTGNVLSGDMTEDFTSFYGMEELATFFFRGVAVERDYLAFVTYKVDGLGAWPGLYELRLGRAGWLSGPWWVPDQNTHGKLRVRRTGERQ